MPTAAPADQEHDLDHAMQPPDTLREALEPGAANARDRPSPGAVDKMLGPAFKADAGGTPMHPIACFDAATMLTVEDGFRFLGDLLASGKSRSHHDYFPLVGLSGPNAKPLVGTIDIDLSGAPPFKMPDGRSLKLSDLLTVSATVSLKSDVSGEIDTDVELKDKALESTWNDLGKHGGGPSGETMHQLVGKVMIDNKSTLADRVATVASAKCKA